MLLRFSSLCLVDHFYGHNNFSPINFRMALVGIDFRAPLRDVKRVQFGILSPDEIVSFGDDENLVLYYDSYHEPYLASNVGRGNRVC